jgi:DNA-binding HxlR family transcriptional regulator
MKSKDTKAQVGTESSHSSHKETCDGECPIGRLIELLSGRWAFPVLYQLLQAEGPIRFGQLQRSVGSVTQKELTKTLRVFEERGLVKRKIYAEVPPRVEYRLTALGASLREPLCGMARWAKTHMKEIKAVCPERTAA